MGHTMPHDFSGRRVPTRHISDSFDFGNRRDRIIDASSTVVTEHTTTSIATLDVHGDPVNKRWYNGDNHHKFSGNEYSSGRSRNRQHPSVYAQDIEIVSIEVEGEVHDDYYNNEGCEDDHEYSYGRDHYEITGYDDDDTIEYVVEEVETGHGHEDNTEVEVEIELDLEESLEYDHGDDGTYAHDQLAEAYIDSGAVYDTQQDMLSQGYDDDDAIELNARPDLDYEDESGFDLIGDGEGYDGDGNGFDYTEDGEQDYGDDDGHVYEGDENDFDEFDDNGQVYGDDYVEDDNGGDDYGDDGGGDYGDDGGGDYGDDGGNDYGDDDYD